MIIFQLKTSMCFTFSVQSCLHYKRDLPCQQIQEQKPQLGLGACVCKSSVPGTEPHPLIAPAPGGQAWVVTTEVGGLHGLKYLPHGAFHKKGVGPWSRNTVLNCESESPGEAAPDMDRRAPRPDSLTHRLRGREGNGSRLLTTPGDAEATGLGPSLCTSWVYQ